MISSSSLLVLLCSTLGSTTQVPLEYGTNQNPTVKLPSDTTLRLDIPRTALLRSNITEIRSFDVLQKQSVPEVSSKSSVHLPVDQIRCENNMDCAIHGLPLVCDRHQGLCECIYPYCWVYVVNTSTWPAVNVFTCGTCGTPGSSCNSTINCTDPGWCSGDGFCHCRHNGEHDQDGICWIADTSWALMIALCAMGLILLFAVIVTAYNLYVTRPWENGCGRRRRPARDVTTRDSRNMKTPAFTVRDFYGYEDSQGMGTSQIVQADGQTINSSSSSTALDYEIRENIAPEMNISVQQESTSIIESPELVQRGFRCTPSEPSAESSARSSVSSNSSCASSERHLIPTSDSNSAQNGHSSGILIGRAFNRGQRRIDDFTESTRF